jgi:hypothetical protein
MALGLAAETRLNKILVCQKQSRGLIAHVTLLRMLRALFRMLREAIRRHDH